MNKHELYSYIRVLRLLNLTQHAIERYYERLPEDEHKKPGNIKREVALSLSDKLKAGCPVKGECIHLPFKEDFTAIIKPGINNWNIITFY